MDRLKRGLVDSFVGAICIGWMLAQGFLHLVAALVLPVNQWIVRQALLDARGRADDPGRYKVENSLPDLASAIVIFVIAYVLLRWLYFKPVAEVPAQDAPAAANLE